MVRDCCAAGTPREIVSRLNAEVRRVLALPDIRQRFAELGMTIAGSTSDEFDVFIKAEVSKWSKVIRDADIRAPD